MTLGQNKKSYLIVLEKSVKEKIDEIALKNSRSSSNLINLILKQYIESRDGEK
jgi:predicted transcriptional regulator